MVMSDTQAELHVCITCRGEVELAAGEATPGQRLFDAIDAELAAQEAPAVVLHPVVCLGICAQGCSAAVTQKGKWSTLLGTLSPERAGDLVKYATSFAASEDGSIKRAFRPSKLRDAIVARIPGHGAPRRERA
jgi:predicted metal-binding protein